MILNGQGAHFAHNNYIEDLLSNICRNVRNADIIKKELS